MLNNFLKQIRQEKKIGQSELANKLGISRQMIWGYENGKYEIPQDALNKLSEVLGVSANQIITGKGQTIESTDSINKDKLLEAIKSAKEFYKDYAFEEDMLLKIAIEIYNLRQESIKTDNISFNKLLNDKIISGLAARYFIDFSKK